MADNVNVVQQAYQNFQTGNIPGVIAQMSSDIEWQIPNVANLRVSGARRGTTQVTEFFKMLGEDQQPLQFEPREFIAQGDKVIALGHYKWTVTSTGKEFESDFAHVFTVRDGKVVRFQEYFDSAAANAAYI